MTRLVLPILLLSAPIFATPTLSVRGFECTRNESKAVCFIDFKGTVSKDQFLYISQVSDADRAYFGMHEIGRTGYFFDSPFYAHYVPRTYSLRELEGVVDPMIEIQAQGLFAAEDVGLSHIDSEVR